MSNKTIRESFGPVHEGNSTIDKETLPEAKTPEFEVKYSSRKSGPIKVTKFMSQGEAQAFLKKIRGEGMQGIVSKGGKPVRTPMKEDAKSDRLAKIARAADAREKDQAKQKSKATEKHNQNSAKSRAGIDYLKKGGNKDQFGRVRENTSEDDDDATFTKKRRTHVRNSARKVKAAMNDYGTNPSRKNAKRADAVNLGHDMVKRTWKDSAAKRRAAAKNEEVEQVDEISLKKKIQTYTKMAGDARVGDYDHDQSRKLEKRRAGQMLNKIEKKHGSKAASHAKRSADFDKDDANTYTSPREKRQARKHGDPLASRQPVSTMKGGPRKGKVRPEDAKNRKFDMRQAARSRAARKTRNEEFEITESDKAEYDKLMKQYGDMPASKIPPKTYMRISQLGRKVRGDKGGPKVGDLLKSMKKRKMGEEVDQVEEAFSPSVIKKMKQVLDRTGMGDINAAMKINDTLPKDAKKVLSKVKNSKELDKYLKANEEVDQISEATRKPSKIKKGTTFFDKKVPETKPKPSILKRKYSEETNEATNKFPKWWEDTPKNVLTKVYHAKRQLPPKLDKKSWQKIVNALHDKRPAPLADYRKWSTMDPAKIQYNKESADKVIGEESIKINGGSAVEIGKNERGSKTQYYWKDKSGLKNVFDTPQKLRYSLRNDANFSGAEKAVKQLLGEAKMGAIARNVKKGDSPYTVVAIVNNKVVDQDHAKIPDQVPALVRELKKEYPNAKISVEDRGGRVVHSEAFEAGISEEVDGWVAMYNGKRLEIPNDGTVKGIAGAKAKAIKDLKVPKSKIGMLAIKPAVNEGRIGGGRRSFRGSGMKHIRIRDDEGYRKDGSNPVDDAIRRRNDARRRAAAAQKAKQTNKDPKKKFEDVEIEEGGMIGRTKPSRELNVSREEKPHLAGKSSLKDKKRDAHKAERAKAKKQLKSFKEY